MKKLLNFTLILTVIFVMAFPLMAQRHHMHRMKGEMNAPRGLTANIISQLDLTAEQKDKISELRRQQVLARFDHRQVMRKIGEDRRAIIQADEIDKSAAYRLIDTAAEIQADWQKKSYDHMMKVLSVLTPEQQQKLKALREERKERREDRSMKPGRRARGMMDQRREPRKGERMHRSGRDSIRGKARIGMALRQLNLTEKQKDEMAELRREQVLARFDHQQALRKIREDKQKLGDILTADKSTVYNLIDKAAAIRADGKKKMFDHLMKMRSVLTEEQIQKLKQLREKRRGNFPRGAW